MRKTIPHIVACRRHVQKRARRRLGIILSYNGVKRLEARIVDGNASYIGDAEQGAAIYKLRYKGLQFYVVYSHSKECLVTILTPRQANQNRRLGHA